MRLRRSKTGNEKREYRGVRSFLARAAGNVALLLFGLTMALLVAEVVVRVVRPQQLILTRPDIWQPVDTLGWKHQPDVSTTVNTGEKLVRFYTDHESFRVGANGRVEADKKVLVLGDSFLEALQVEYEESIPGILEERLPECSGTRRRRQARRDARPAREPGRQEPRRCLL